MSLFFKIRNFSKNEVLLFASGVNLILLNFIMVQHVSVAFRHMELAVLIFTLSYFSGISLGYFFSNKLTTKLMRQMLIPFMIIQMALLIFLQPLSYILRNALTEWGNYIAIYFLLTFTVTSFYAIFLPRIIETLQKNVKHCYSIEIIGSIIGLGLVPILANISHTLLLAVYFLIFLWISYLIKSHRWQLIFMSVVLIIFLWNYDAWDKSTSGWFYKKRYPNSHVERVIHTHFTPYHKIEVLELSSNENMLMLNGKRQFARGSHFTYSYFEAEYPARLLGKPKVCLLGCGSMSTVGRIGNFVPSIKIVDLDESVFNTSKRFFQKYNHLNQLNNWTFQADDAKHFLANNTEKFDLIMHDIPPARSRQTALTYTREFFELVKENLTPQGIFAISCLSPFHSNYGKRMIATLSQVFDNYFLLQYKNTVYFYGGGKNLKKYSRNILRAAITHPKKKRVRIYLKSEIKKIIKKTEIITVNNIGNLIFAK